jgi:Rrf2 family nitric oxide-sensitive transcriptional repressor
MQLTLFTDYSLRTLVFLGAHTDRLCTIGQIAQAYDISDNHLMKVVNRLAARGYVETIRGKGGGLRLAHEPKQVNIGAVVRDMEERFDLVECFDEARQSCPLLPACALKSMLDAARRNFLATLDRHTLQDVLDGGAGAVFLRAGAKRIPIHKVD